jgi:outer membrane protein OmpA-like peptidoglycan-associated protein
MMSLTDSLSLRTDLRFLLSLGTENYQNRGDAFLSWEWTTGVNLRLGGPKDMDKDGIVDEEDSCIDEPEDFDNFKDEDGCPEDDNDGDGIVDADDQCPGTDADDDTAEDIDDFEDADGCPDLDNDGDGIADTDDDCPLVAGGEATGGCPDADGDGIRNADDECEDEAGKEGSFGCPDGDEDRVPDYRDDCPEEPGWEEAIPLLSDGCKGRVYVTKKFLVVTEKIQFDSGRATIKKASHALLDDIFEALQKNASLTELLIAGHTDDRGDDAKNLTLSEDRAKAVKTYLVDKGIDKKRIKGKGFGETEPIGDNATREGRDENRRVEFRIKSSKSPEALKRAAIKKNEEKKDDADAEKKDDADKGDDADKDEADKGDDADKDEADKGDDDKDEADKGDDDKGDDDKGEADKGEADKGDADKGDADKGEADKGEADKGDADKGDAEK